MKMIQKVGFGSVAFLAAGSAFAALDPDISAALEAAKTDGMAVAGLVLGVIIAIAAFKYIRRAL